MHPHHYHASTTDPLDEARWLGFWRKGLHTEPMKKVTPFFATEHTPSKVSEPMIKSLNPEFQFTFKRQSAELSPAAKIMMEESRDEAVKIRSRMVSRKDVTTAADVPLSPERRIAKPKSRAGRFSDVHVSEFRKMDSIANHPSAFRADPNRGTRPILKRSRSKTDLDKSEESIPKKNTTSPVSHRGTAASASFKRIKCSDGDISSAKSVSKDRSLGSNMGSGMASYVIDRSKPGTGRPKAASGLSTPSKASCLPRSKSTKCIKMSMAPSVLGSGPRKSLFPAPLSIATKTPETPESKSKAAMSLKSPSIQSPTIKSILRRPQILYSDDPLKIAAGTHIAVPKEAFGARGSPITAPATAPVRKHVDFTASIKEKAEKDEMKISNWSFLKDSIFGTVKQADSEDKIEHPLPVTYPTLRPVDELIASPSPVRRKTLGSGRDFTFRAGSPLKFNKPNKDTFSSAQKNDTESLTKAIQVPNAPSIKRKLEETDDSDKENVEESERPAKRAKPTGTEKGMKMEVKSKAEVQTVKPRNRLSKASPHSRLQQRKENRSVVLSRARLNFLAMPRQRR